MSLRSGGEGNPMNNAVWRLTTLAGIVGIGLCGVMNAQRGLDKDPSTPAATLSSDEPDAPGAKKTAEGRGEAASTPSGPDDFRGAEPVPAVEKNGTQVLADEQEEP